MLCTRRHNTYTNGNDMIIDLLTSQILTNLSKRCARAYLGAIDADFRVQLSFFSKSDSTGCLQSFWKEHNIRNSDVEFENAHTTISISISLFLSMFLH